MPDGLAGSLRHSDLLVEVRKFTLHELSAVAGRAGAGGQEGLLLGEGEPRIAVEQDGGDEPSRRFGVAALTGNPGRCGTLRWQPITLDLAGSVAELARTRGAVHPTDALLRYRNGDPLTSRRYDQLWRRIGQQLPWVAAQNISTHWLRHTTLTWVERHFNYGVARAYAGHTDAKGAATTTYIKGYLVEVATALSAMTGQPHPHADPNHGLLAA